MKRVKIGQRYKLVPQKVYVYYSVIKALQRLVRLPGFLESCENWRKRGTEVPSGCLTDVYDGNIWKEWMKTANGVPFLEVPGNLLFMLNIDWFQPFEHTQYSIGVIYLVIQNLPRSVRFKPENIIIVSTIPGPKEPSCAEINPYLEPLVSDLLKLWDGVQMQTPGNFILPSRTIRAALVYISCDLPATRKICGFYGIRAMYGCSKCLKCFPSTFGSNTDYSGFDRSEWQIRTSAAHHQHIQRCKDAKTRTERDSRQQEAGARYSELLKLPYFDIVRYHLVDPMHNLFLGTAKKMLTLWKDRGLIDNHKFREIQDQIDDINPPPNIGRIPHKIAAGFAGFTAEQWMLWTTLYSPLILGGVLSQVQYTHWCLFSRACSLLCCPYVRAVDVEKADELLLTFLTQFQNLYGESECTANMHMHCHLKQSVMDVGPLHSFWCFSFERYNGILENMQKSWQAPELQLIYKFSNLQSLASVELSQAIPPELCQCFTQMKQAKTALPDTTIDGVAFLKYEENLLCYPKHVCAARLPFHHPIPPGREKYLPEEARELLTEMYSVLYGLEKVVHVPLRYEQFHSVEVFNEMYTSAGSRTTRSAAIIAAWPSPGGILTSRKPSHDDIRVGIVQHFLQHTPSVKVSTDERAQTTEKRQHILAKVSWFQDHPQKYLLGNGIILSATVCQTSYSATFIPISRIISRCAIVKRRLQMSYGEDLLCVAIPLKKHTIFSLFHGDHV